MQTGASRGLTRRVWGIVLGGERLGGQDWQCSRVEMEDPPRRRGGKDKFLVSARPNAVVMPP
jgi:hypothetical protein